MQGQDKTFILYPTDYDQVARYGVACSLGRYSLFDSASYDPPWPTDASLSPFGNALVLAQRWRPGWRPFGMEEAFKGLAIACAEGDLTRGDTMKVLRSVGAAPALR